MHKLLKHVDGMIGRVLTTLLPKAGFSAGCIDPEEVLFIRPGGIGDAVHLIPAINLFHERFPRTGVTVLAEKRNRAVFSLCPSVRKVFCYDSLSGLGALLARDYDLVIDTEQWHSLSAVTARLVRGLVRIGFATNERARLFTHPVSYSHDDYEMESFLNLLVPLGIERSGEIPTSFLTVPAADFTNLGQMLPGFSNGDFVVLFPGATIPERRWGAARFREVAEFISGHGYAVVVVGGQGDRQAGDAIVQGGIGKNLAGRISLPETAAVIARSTLFVGGDSGILHLAVGLGIRTVSLFGPGIRQKWAPRGDRHTVLDRGLSCSPCTQFGYTASCSTGAPCMTGITVTAVCEVVGAHLK